MKIDNSGNRECVGKARRLGIGCGREQVRTSSAERGRLSCDLRASDSGGAVDFPSLSAAASAKIKKKNAQAVSLQEFSCTVLISMRRLSRRAHAATVGPSDRTT